MNPKKLLKGILRGTLLLLVFAFIFTHFVVMAKDDEGFSDPVGEFDAGSGCTSLKPEDLCEKSDRKPESPTIVKRYGIQLNPIEGDKFKLTMSKSCGEKVHFKVMAVNKDDKHAAVGQILTCKDSVIIDMTGLPEWIDDANDFGIDGVLVDLRSNCNVIDSPSDPKSCRWNYVDADLFATRVGDAGSDHSDYTIGDLETVTSTNTVIDCDNHSYKQGSTVGTFVDGDGSFYDKFCMTKRLAIKGENGNKSYGEMKDGYTDSNPITLKCDYHINNIPTNSDVLTTEGYWTNSNYFYGYRKHTESATLYYHYAPSSDDKYSHGHIGKKDISCEVTCEEAVEVEYGPPVATSAGMCFEYNVRVTSRISCNMSDPPPADDLCKQDACVPVPDCWHSGGTILTQAGPNDEFNACVQQCDGGKYTKKCSTSCYNQVYGSVSAYAKTNAVYFDEIFGSDIFQKGQQGSKYTCTGYYSSNGKTNSNNKEGRKVKEMYWHGLEENWTTPAFTAGRYYCKGWQNRELSYRENFYADENGFFRKKFSSGLCGAECIWTQCLGDVYLNQYIPCDKVEGGANSKYCKDNKLNILEFDCAKNQETYNNLVRACQDKATCSTTTAYFTVEVDYAKKDKPEKTITLKFPYDNQQDHITYSNTTIDTTQTNENTTLKVAFPSKESKTGILGCYAQGGNKDRYRVTWGTPSTWMNLKTGEISFTGEGKKLVDKGGSWYKVEGQLCLPGDTAPVNVRWANAYLRAKIVNYDIWSELSVYDQEIDALCKYSTTDGSIVTIDPNSITASDITYNIRAKAVDFGMLKWDFNIQCFYGISSCETGVCEPDVSVDCGGEEYRVRSTDLENLFPSTDGSQKGADEAGRLPGYNWSQYAINNKNEDYKSNPVTYMQQLQQQARDAKAAGTEIYTIDNLDYEFILMPDTIREMRKSITGNMGGSNYTAFLDKDFLVSAGVGRYRSSKIRSLGGSNKIPDFPAISCNNMLHYGSSECDPVHNG